MNDTKTSSKEVSLPTSTVYRPSRTKSSWRPLKALAILSVLIAFPLWHNQRSFDAVRQVWDGLSNCKGGHHKRKALVGKVAEDLFLSIPDEESAIATSRLLATKPHLAGSEGDLTTAKDFLSLFQKEFLIPASSEVPIFSAGSPESQRATRSINRARKPHVWIDTYYPVMNTALDRSLAIYDENGTQLWLADLEEHSDDTDPEAGRHSDAVPSFHGLSPSGDVKGQLVDGHYCRKQDYDALLEAGTDFEGKIVLCRYGGIFRGLKVKGAQDLGAIGVLIYTDLRDDGTVTEENGYVAYPNGPARNPSSVQRGSVQYLSVYPGDPTTPGYPSYENSTRTEGENIPKIPSLPISWATADALFKTLPGGSWEGSEVRLVNNVDTKVTPIWNTMSVIPGYIKDEVVIVGNHRDAWVMGATDPSSGTVSVHEVIRGLGALYRKGWKPARTIVIATWDAEEYGLIGSTEWGEDFADWIQDNVVAYLNLDSSVSGSRLGASGSPLLSHLLRETAQDIPHPTDAKRTLWDARQDTGTLFGEHPDGNNTLDGDALAIKEMELAAVDDVGVNPLGSGSDYTVFLQHIGIPSTNGGFGSTLHDPVYHYHSIFDSERWQELYGDPGFHRHVAIAKHLGLQVLRLSGAVVLPFNTTHYAFELENYLDRVESLVSASDQFQNLNLNPLRKSIHALQRSSRKLDHEGVKAEKDLKKYLKKWHSKAARIRRRARKAYCRVRKALGHPCKCTGKRRVDDSVVPLSSLPGNVRPRFGLLPGLAQEEWNDVVSGLIMAAGFDNHHIKGHRHPFAKLRKIVKRLQAVNKKLAAFERGFISKGGIKDREWYKHLGVAPGKWLGYGATTLPGLTEAVVFDKNATLAAHEASRLQGLIERLTKDIKIKEED